jgi:hypothetical protein
MKTETTKELKMQLGQLFCESLRMSNSLYQLQLIRQKIEGRGYQSFDKGDILGELGRLQQTIGTLNSEMLKIHDLLKQQS